ncbi:MAG: ABC transporter permease, partial [Burkholderiales bacterium]
MAVIVLLFVSILIFFTMRLLPGDPILLVLTQSQQNAYSEEDIAAIRHQYGLDKSLFVQYLDWINQIFHGDLGKSILERNPVANEIGRRIPITLYIGLLAFIVGFIIGIPLGIICAVRRGTWIDTL